MIYIYVDDVREPQVSDAIICRTYDSAIAALTSINSDDVEIILDLDHDLGEKHSGYDICRYVIENQIHLAGFIIHSMNPVGVHNMRQLLTHYGYQEFRYGLV